MYYTYIIPETNTIMVLKRHSGGFPAQRPVTQSFDVFFNLRLN